MKEFHLLKCVHVFDKDSNENIFSLHCDNEARRMKYAGEEESISSPRFSGVQYTLMDSTHKYEGQIVGIVAYKQNVRDVDLQICLFINRFTEVDDATFFKRKLPHRLVKYERLHERIRTDVVHVSRVCGPLFIVPALDHGMNIQDCSDNTLVKAHYYVIDEMKVRCLNIIDYDVYLARNNTKFVTNRYRSKEQNLNLNCYLTVEEMNDVKDMLNVYRNIEELNDDFLEAFEFDFEDFEDIDEDA